MQNPLDGVWHIWLNNNYITRDAEEKKMDAPLRHIPTTVFKPPRLTLVASHTPTTSFEINNYLCMSFDESPRNYRDKKQTIHDTVSQVVD